MHQTNNNTPFDNTIHILVSFDQRYIPPFQTMLRSLVLNNPKEHFHIWLLHSELNSADLFYIGKYCAMQNVTFSTIQVARSVFEQAPVFKQYPQEMYYRLLAAQLLPESLERILYLDPDILVINPIRPLWELNFQGATFAAASHSWGSDVINDLNKLRLATEHDYFNTGVLLYDLQRARQIVKSEQIFDYVSKHAVELVLPDQDVFNHLFGKETIAIDDKVWNYDVRYYHAYQIKTNGVCNMDWIMQNTVILHYCGKNKPWKQTSVNRFSVLHKHYANLALQLCITSDLSNFQNKKLNNFM